MTREQRLIEDWLRWKVHNQGRAPTTARKYRLYLGRLQAYLADRGKDLAGATHQDLEHFTGLYMHEQGQRPRSRRAIVAAVRQFYGWLVKVRQLPANPASEVPYPMAGKPLPVALQLHHAEALLMAPGISTFRGLRDTTMIAFLVGCGIRVSGLVGMNESSLLFVRHEQRESLVIRVREKGGKERLVPAPDDCWALVRAYLGHPELEDIDRSLRDGDQVLFVSTANRLVPPHQYHGEARRLTARSVHDIIQAHGRRVGVPADQLHPHAMRHLYGTEFAESDVDLLIRQALMGHEDPKSTEVYTRLAARKLREVVDRANPLAKIRTPVGGLVRELRQA